MRDGRFPKPRGASSATRWPGTHDPTRPRRARIETLRARRTPGSTPFAPAGQPDRHPSQPSNARIDTPGRLDTADRDPFLTTTRIDTLLTRRTLRSTPFAPAGHPDRHPSQPSNARIDTPGRLDTADRDPFLATTRIETLRTRRTPGSTPFAPAGHPDRDPQPARHCGSRPFAPDRRGDRRPFGPVRTR